MKCLPNSWRDDHIRGGIQQQGAYEGALMKKRPSNCERKTLSARYNSHMETVVRERRRIFERPEEPRPMRLTGRDVALLQNIARLRLATTVQLAALDGG